MKKQKELKPCPFCASTDLDYIKDMLDKYTQIHIIRCNNCMVSMPDVTKNVTVKKWNKREMPKLKIVKH